MIYVQRAGCTRRLDCSVHILFSDLLCTPQDLFKWFTRLLPIFSCDKCDTKCWVHLNRSATLSKALKKVKSLSNGSQVKFKLDQTFAQIP